MRIESADRGIYPMGVYTIVYARPRGGRDDTEGAADGTGNCGCGRPPVARDITDELRGRIAAAPRRRPTVAALISSVMGAIGHALALAGSMTWEVLWALILGFGLSAVVHPRSLTPQTSAAHRGVA